MYQWKQELLLYRTGIKFTTLQLCLQLRQWCLQLDITVADDFLIKLFVCSFHRKSSSVCLFNFCYGIPW